MKILVKPLIASALVIATAGVNAQSYSGEKVDDLIYEMDDNGNRSVNFQEFYEDKVTYNDSALDVNKDGYISEGEVVIEMKEEIADSIKEMRKHGVSEKNIKKTVRRELKSVEADASEILKKMDADGDHLVEPSELVAYQKKQFRKLDRNRDGVISSEDIKKIEKTKSKGWPIRR